MQTVRLAGVLLIFPYWIKVFTRNEAAGEQDGRLVMGSGERSDTPLDRLARTPGQKIAFTLAVSILTGILGNASGTVSYTHLYCVHYTEKTHVLQYEIKY